MILRKSDILNYIPHREPFLMVDCLVEHTKEEGVVNFIVNKDNIMMVQDELSEEGLLEHQAQALALCMGYAQSKENDHPKVGVIGALKKCEIYNLPNVGDTIKTEITIQSQFLNMVLAGVKTYDDKGSLLAQAIIKTASIS